MFKTSNRIWDLSLSLGLSQSLVTDSCCQPNSGHTDLDMTTWNYVTVISLVTVAHSVVRWLPTRLSGVRIPQMSVGGRGGKMFLHLLSKHMKKTDWPRILQSYQQWIVGFFPPAPSRDWGWGFPPGSNASTSQAVRAFTVPVKEPHSFLQHD